MGDTNPNRIEGGMSRQTQFQVMRMQVPHTPRQEERRHQGAALRPPVVAAEQLPVEVVVEQQLGPAVGCMKEMERAQPRKQAVFGPKLGRTPP